MSETQTQIQVHNPNNLPTIPWRKLQPFQGDFKRKPAKAKINKLKESIRRHGIFVPKFVWWKDGKPFIVDGHQTRSALASLERDGYEIPEIPIVAVEASSEKDAAEKLLVLNSRYAEINPETDWLAQFDFDLSELEAVLELPEIDLEKLLEPATSSSGGENTAPVRPTKMEELALSAEELEVLRGRFFCVEFSGGKDSSAAALWLRANYEVLDPAGVQLCFVDMGADYVGFHEHLYSFAQAIDFELKMLRSPKHMIDFLLEKGKWPWGIHPYCHQMLHGPLDDHLKSIGQEKVVDVRGGRMGESSSGGKKNTTRFLEVDRLPGYLFFQPLYFATQTLCEEIIASSACPVWDGYSRGLQRPACRICPGQKPRAYTAIRSNFPDVWEELLWLEQRLGPGCWQDPNEEFKGEFEEMANLGAQQLAREAAKKS